MAEERQIILQPIIHGQITNVGATTQTTVGSAGSATALPANPTGYLKVVIDNVERVIPFYDVS